MTMHATAAGATDMPKPGKCIEDYDHLDPKLHRAIDLALEWGAVFAIPCRMVNGDREWNRELFTFDVLDDPRRKAASRALFAACDRHPNRLRHLLRQRTIEAGGYLASPEYRKGPAAGEDTQIAFEKLLGFVAI